MNPHKHTKTDKTAVPTLSLLCRIRSETTDRRPFFKDELDLLGLSVNRCGGGFKFELYKN